MNWCYWVSILSPCGQWAMTFERFQQDWSREQCEAELEKLYGWMRERDYKPTWSAVDPSGMQEIYDCNETAFRAMGVDRP